MDALQRFSMLCGLVAMCAVGLAALVLGYSGLSFSSPWLGRLFLCLVAEVVLMAWLGPLPAALVIWPLSYFPKRWQRLNALRDRLFRPLVLGTAVGLAVLLLRFTRPDSP
jgi:hypothetical protein